jgi:phosphatidylserine decarboxylase
MSSESADPVPIEAPDPQLTCIQPGGGVCMQLELAWGRLRRALLRRFRPRYVERMRTLRQGSTGGCPIEPIDWRDIKFYQNVCNVTWPVPDRFAWRDRLPLVRVGLAELIVCCCVSLLAALLLGRWSWAAALVALVPAAFALWFFRNPRRRVPQEPGLVVSPADGRVVTIEPLDDDEFVGGPALLIGIFLSVFDVHINRSPVEAVIVGQSYRRGKFLNALRPESARENEQLEHRLQELATPHRCLRVRQIAGAIARRIVCWTPPGHTLARGQQFGMIKFGSRTEIILSREEGFRVAVRIGQRVWAGTTVLGQYSSETTLREATDHVSHAGSQNPN